MRRIAINQLVKRYDELKGISYSGDLDECKKLCKFCSTPYRILEISREHRAGVSSEKRNGLWIQAGQDFKRFIVCIEKSAITKMRCFQSREFESY